MVKYWYELSKSAVATATKSHSLMDETMAVSALLILAKIPLTTRVTAKNGMDVKHSRLPTQPTDT